MATQESAHLRIEDVEISYLRTGVTHPDVVVSPDWALGARCFPSAPCGTVPSHACCVALSSDLHFVLLCRGRMA